ncbi:MAG: hypothetical protein ACXAAO_13535 [Candidatus Thorarchaeota archaeon]
MDFEKKRTDEYWMGVRDSLRMVDSFNKWAQRNKERAKDLDDFIHDGLIAAAKRCESCLKDDLGLTFVEGEDNPLAEQVPSGYEVTPDEKEESSILREESDEVLSSPSEEDISMKSVDGPTREFTSDFELVEPTPLTVESESSEITIESSEQSEDTKPSFTWADYEEAVSPINEKLEVMEDSEDEPSDALDSIEEESFPTDEPLPIEPTKVLMPSEEPAIPTDEFDSPVEKDPPTPPDTEEIEETDSVEPITEPPPPPPPPESEEDEDERRRRARRLFFGD